MDEYSKELLKLVPPGFDIDKYQTGSTCDPSLWWDNINRRHDADWLLSGREHPFLSNEHDDIKEFISKNIDNGFFVPALKKPTTVKYNDFLIDPLRVADLKMINDHLKYIEKQKCVDDDTEIDEMTDFSGVGISYVTVDLNAPDNVLVNQFKQWLATSRNKLDIQARQNEISNATFRRWHGNKVIAYLDLIQWHRFNGTNIYDHQAAAIIFKNDSQRDTTAVIEKTVRKKLVPEILSRAVREALLSQCEA